MLQGPKDQPCVAAALFGGQCVLPLAVAPTSTTTYSCDARTYPKTRVWGSEPENVHCSSATAPLKIELRWGCEESRKKTAVGSGVTFKYDPFGHRIQKSFTQSGTTTTTNFLYDADNLIEEVDPSGNVLARYTQTQDIDEPLAMLRSGATSYYNADALGSVTSLANGAGTLAQTYTFDSFGKTTASSGSLTNPFRFTGREFDSESSLYFMRARYFDPATGRFVSEDPARFPGGINFYTYVENNPVNLIDPFGFCPWQVHSRPLKGVPGAGPLGIDHYYFYNTQTGQSIGLGPATNTLKGPVPGNWEKNEKPGHNEGPVPDWACNCVDKKAKNPGKPPNYCTFQGNGNHNPHPGCTNCIGWVQAVLQDCYNQASAGQQ